jgi:delta24-sterol reductase
MWFLTSFYFKLGMFNDLGVYGVPGPVKRKERFDAVGAMRKMEKYYTSY